MSTSTSDKFNKIINCKEQIRKAINKKGSRVAPDVPLDQYATKINAIPFYEEGSDNGFAGFISDLLSLKTDASYLFYNPNSQSALVTLNDESIGYLNKIGLSDTKKTNYMFANNNYIQTIGTLEFNQVTDCTNMFYNDNNLTNVILDIGISGTQQYPFQYMFQGTAKLKDLDLRIRRTGNFSTTTSTYYMFAYTGKSATDWDSTNFYIDIDVPNLALQGMFYNNNFTNLSFLKNTKIKCDIDSCSWDSLFSGCVNLTDIEFPEGCELPKPTSLNLTFGYTPLMQSNEQMQHFFDTIDLSAVSNMNSMFRMKSTAYCNFQDLNLTITLPVDEQSCSISNMFDCSSNYYMNESKVTYFSFNGKGTASGLFREYSNNSSSYHGLRTVDEINLPYVTSFEGLFYYCYFMTSIDTINSGDDLLSTYQMFYYCYNLIDVPVFNTSKVTSFKQMFQYCNKITEIPALDLGGVANTSLYSWNDNGNPYYYIVYGCPNLERFHCTNIKQSIDLSVSTKFTREALLEVIGNLYDISDRQGGGTLYLHIGSTNLAKLTSEDIALATEKGWTIN